MSLDLMKDDNRPMTSQRKVKVSFENQFQFVLSLHFKSFLLSQVKCFSWPR